MLTIRPIHLVFWQIEGLYWQKRLHKQERSCARDLADDSERSERSKALLLISRVEANGGTRSLGKEASSRATSLEKSNSTSPLII